MSSPSNSAFEDYFEKIYGPRWPKLRDALSQHERQVLRKNKFAEVATPAIEKCEFLDDCFWRPENFKLEKNAQGLYDFYAMDPASLLVAKALEVAAGNTVLDLCAAPGGKTLALAEKIDSGQADAFEPGSLVSNEYSEARRSRLIRVLHEYIPQDRRMFIHVKGMDGNQYGLRYADTFDRILADVPCSGERHLLENPKEFALWSVHRTKSLAVRQYSLLSSAWLALQGGGRLVYSTCSISPEENEAVIKKLVKKRQPKILNLAWLDKLDFVEKTQHGYQILPDRAAFGPMYFSVIEK